MKKITIALLVMLFTATATFAQKYDMNRDHNNDWQANNYPGKAFGQQHDFNDRDQKKHGKHKHQCDDRKHDWKKDHKRNGNFRRDDRNERH